MHGINSIFLVAVLLLSIVGCQGEAIVFNVDPDGNVLVALDSADLSQIDNVASEIVDESQNAPPLADGSIFANNSNNASHQVKLIYHVPADKEIKPAYKSAIEDTYKNIQAWFLKESLNQTTFKIMDDGQAEVIQSERPELWFQTPQDNISNDAFTVFYNTEADIKTKLGNRQENVIWVVLTDVDLLLKADGSCSGAGAARYGIAIMPSDDLKGLSGEQPICTENTVLEKWQGGQAFQLAHAFGLPRPYKLVNEQREYLLGFENTCPNSDCLMMTGFFNYPETYLVPQQKDLLLANPFFTEQLLPEQNLQNKNSNLCMDLQFGSVKSQTPIVQYTCSPTAKNFLWRMHPIDFGEYWIINNKSRSCLNIPDSNLNNDAVATIHTCLKTDNFLWQKQEKPDGSFLLINKASQKCLAVSLNSLDNFSVINQQDCNEISTSWEAVESLQMKLESLLTIKLHGKTIDARGAPILNAADGNKSLNYGNGRKMFVIPGINGIPEIVLTNETDITSPVAITIEPSSTVYGRYYARYQSRILGFDFWVRDKPDGSSIYAISANFRDMNGQIIQENIIGEGDTDILINPVF